MSNILKNKMTCIPFQTRILFRFSGAELLKISDFSFKWFHYAEGNCSFIYSYPLKINPYKVLFCYEKLTLTSIRLIYLSNCSG